MQSPRVEAAPCTCPVCHDDRRSASDQPQLTPLVDSLLRAFCNAPCTTRVPDRLKEFAVAEPTPQPIGPRGPIQTSLRSAARSRRNRQHSRTQKSIVISAVCTPSPPGQRVGTNVVMQLFFHRPAGLAISVYSHTCRKRPITQVSCF